MTERIAPTPCPFTSRERKYIRRELDMFFGTLPSVAEGFQLWTWRGGPLAGQPKVPPPVRQGSSAFIAQDFTLVHDALNVCSLCPPLADIIPCQPDPPPDLESFERHIVALANSRNT